MTAVYHAYLCKRILWKIDSSLTHNYKRRMWLWSMRTLSQVYYQAFPGSAMCVQNFDDSRGPAFRITYRISLRSSSLWKPRHPLLKVVCYCVYCVVSHLPHGRRPFTNLTSVCLVWMVWVPTTRAGLYWGCDFPVKFAEVPVRLSCDLSALLV